MTDPLCNDAVRADLQDCNFDQMWPPEWVELLWQDANLDVYDAQDLVEPDPPVSAIRVSPGVGKTRTVIELFSKIGGPLVYVVPTHRLGEEVVEEFALYDIRARLFRGRSAFNPSDDGGTMCRDLSAVQIAIDHGFPVSESCCKGKGPDRSAVECAFFDACPYQLQFDDGPDVWVITKQLLFQAQKALRTPRSVVIDESFWQDGIYHSDMALTLLELASPVIAPLGGSWHDAHELGELRYKLAQALRKQKEAGGVRRRTLEDEGITHQDCVRATALEWKMMDKLEMWPGMPEDARKTVARSTRSVKQVQLFARVWQAACDLLSTHKRSAISGRLYFDDADGDPSANRILKTRGVKRIAKQWCVPTLIMDATLPPKAMLQQFYPEVQVLKEIEAEMPHAHVRQVLDAPVTATKLELCNDSETSRNLLAIRRAIIGRFIEFGRKPTLVILQKDPADWLRASNLPDEITIEHFNNVAGLDKHKDVRLLITIGRPMPVPAAVEALAAAISGLEPSRLKSSDGRFRWYDKVRRGIRLPDGSGVPVHCDLHPDPLAEACRWQICEGELVQAIGRGRAVNRTEINPLQVEIWANVVLPITVDEVIPWHAVSSGVEVELVSGGMLLESATDSAKCWPFLWPTAGAARQWRRRAGEHKRTKSYIDSFIASRTLVIRYQHKGERRKWRHAWYDPTVINDPRHWLEEHLGQLAKVDVTSEELPEAVAFNADA